MIEESIALSKVWEILEQIPDPEIPVLSIVDLGIVREINRGKGSSTDEQNRALEVIITPTYSGCPAMDVIAISIRMALLKNGFSPVRISRQLSPAWTTNWITKSGRDKLKSYGIAPPQTTSYTDPGAILPGLRFAAELCVECPRCQCTNTKLISQFGSTACKALYQCNDCKEPFDYFKCH